MKKKPTFFYLLNAVLALLLGACSNDPSELKIAPLGERAVLEELAESWTAVSNKKLSVSPMSLPGDDRKRFLEQVFVDAGYNYSATLNNIASQGVDRTNQLHVDMAELVLMPHRNPKYPIDPADIYTVEELKNVAAIERMLKM